MRTVILWILMITGPILATAQIDFEKFNGNYMRWRAQEGFIIADRFISPERSIAQGNYRYTEPEDGLLSFYYDNGYTSLRSEGQRDYLQIGIRAPQISIFERPPVHLAVALNANSYFELANQFDWISDALVSLSKGMRRQDRLSIAAMTSDGREDILLPLSLMHRQGYRNVAYSHAHDLRSLRGSSGLRSVQEGYSQLSRFYTPGYYNHLLYISNGFGGVDVFRDLVQANKEKGLGFSLVFLENITPIGPELELAKSVGGNVVIVQSPEELQDLFDNRLEELFVPVADDLEVRLVLPQWMRFVDAWGLEYSLKGQALSFRWPRVFSGEELTLLIEVDISSGLTLEQLTYPTVNLSYHHHQTGRISQTLPPPSVVVTDGLSLNRRPDNPQIFQSSTYKELSDALLDFNRAYAQSSSLIQERRDAARAAVDAAGPFANLQERREFSRNFINDELIALDEAITQSYKRAGLMALDALDRVREAQNRVGADSYRIERDVFLAYAKTMLRRLGHSPEAILDFAESGTMRSAFLP